jgi:hypothetical protein
VHTFESQGLVFALDRAGVEIANADVIQIDLSCEDAGLDPDHAAEQLGARLTKLLGEEVSDEEGMFDLAVSKDGAIVAALAVACEDDTLELGGERTAAVTDEELAAALAQALAGGTE